MLKILVVWDVPEDSNLKVLESSSALPRECKISTWFVFLCGCYVGKPLSNARVMLWQYSDWSIRSIYFLIYSVSSNTLKSSKNMYLKYIISL